MCVCVTEIKGQRHAEKKRLRKRETEVLIQRKRERKTHRKRDGPETGREERRK